MPLPSPVFYANDNIFVYSAYHFLIILLFTIIYGLIGKVSDDGRDWGQEEKGTTEDEMAGWHH